MNFSLSWDNNIFCLFVKNNFLFKNLFIFSISIPPSLKILGLSIKLTIVDSKPILHLPPSKINLILFPNSSKTSFLDTGLTFEDIFALGAARG